MLSVIEFESLLQRPESTLLDFKASMYDFSDDSELRSTAKFIKDVISFCNTIRAETSYIITGVEQGSGGEKILHGLVNDVDDAIFQDKVKDKVYPRPVFQYYSIVFNGKKFGVFEFPKVKYATPLQPVLKMKGLEPGKVYSRQGTANTEALALEVIRINDWLRSLPDVHPSKGIDDEIQLIIRDLAAAEKKLSVVIAEMLALAKKYDLTDLIVFCDHELKGTHANDARSQHDNFSYRVQTVFISTLVLQINAFSNLNNIMIKREFESNKDFYQMPMLFNQSIVSIEEHIRNMQAKPNQMIATVKMNAKTIFQDTGSDYSVTAYIFPDNFQALYASIRQRCIDEVMKIKR